MSSGRRSSRKGKNVDRLFLRELKIDTVIGFWDWERRIKQTVSLDVEVGTDASIASRSDEIADGLNYDALAKRLVAFVGASKFQLVESLAEAVARIALDEFGAPWVKVSITKPGAVQDCREVGIVIERRATGDA
jgi:7,8-dihydroneopterin aldolase/epimerase/oxygenase